MKGKLIIHGNSYALILDDKMVAFAHPEEFSNDNTIGKLSLKNCQAIEHGYDLDELALHSVNFSDCENESEYKKTLSNYKKGFQKAIELIGDKKFNIDDLSSILVDFLNDLKKMKYRGNEVAVINQLIQSLKQTEWDVEVETEPMNIDEIRKEGRGFLNSNTEKLKLDSNGHLILKRI